MRIGVDATCWQNKGIPLKTGPNHTLRLEVTDEALTVGQQQRLALARDLAIDLKTVLADEPTSALDPIPGRPIEKQFKGQKRTSLDKGGSQCRRRP